MANMAKNTEKLNSTGTESVKVSVRVRPFNEREKAQTCDYAVRMNSVQATVVVYDLMSQEKKKSPKNFQFDNVFWSLDCPDESGKQPAGQLEVYETIGRPLVRHAFNGFNSCLFAYGQTGSGKTYTMMGGDPNALGGADAGVTPRLCLELFQMRAHIEAEGHSKWTVEVGYVEVYNERVSDLLAKRKKSAKSEEVFVDVREHPTKGVFIEGQQFREVGSLDDVVTLIEMGNRVRHTAATKMNDRSSRSHAIFMLMLREERSMQTATGQMITTAGKNSRMNLVDLAGSERVSQSEVVGQQFSEARYINLSLTTLGRVIDMLADMAKNDNSQWSMPPYRESKLTFILKDSLGGNSKTFMIATVSPSAMNYDETLSTLRYASRARDIVNLTKVNEDPRARRIRELEEQMEQMRKDIQGKDPVYVAELEEKLALLEAEALKRAADLQALEREREKNEIREKMLRATEAERQELLGKATELEKQVDESRRQAEYHEQMSQRLKEEHAQRERELMEEVRRQEKAMESVRRRKDAEVLSGQEQLRKTMSDLERERHEREEALRALGMRQEELSVALSDSRQSAEQRKELQRQNEELAARMRQLESERDKQQRLLRELQSIRKERDTLETTKELHLTELEEMEKRYDDTLYHLLSSLDLISTFNDALLSRLGMDYETRIRQGERWYADELGELKKQHADELAGQLKAAEEARAAVEKNLRTATTERDALQQQLHSTSDELAGQLKAAEEARAAVEKNLETTTTERDALQQQLRSTSDELAGQLKASEEARAAVEKNLRTTTTERDALQQQLHSTSDELDKQKNDYDDLFAECGFLRRRCTDYNEAVETVSLCKEEVAILKGEIRRMEEEKCSLVLELEKERDDLRHANVRISALRKLLSGKCDF